MFLCLHDSATTNIYTHGHTLSRRGSRPLYVSVQMDMVSVAAQVGGLITEVAVREGQQVAKGQLLFRIDGHPYALSVAQANAAIDSAQVDVGNLSASLATTRSEEHTSELESLMRISYAVFCLKKKKTKSIRQKQTSSNERDNKLQ